MPTIEIADVTIVTRTHEIPEACPKCGADFTADEALRYHDLAIAMGHGQLEQHAAEAPAGRVFVDGEDDDRPETFATIDVECMECEAQDWWDGENGWKLSGEYVEQNSEPERLVVVEFLEDLL